MQLFFLTYPHVVFIYPTNTVEVVLHSRHASIHHSSFTHVPLCFGQLLLPLFEEFGHHCFGAVTLVQRPQVLDLKGHFVAFNGHTEGEKEQTNLVHQGSTLISLLTLYYTVFIVTPSPPVVSFIHWPT